MEWISRKRIELQNIIDNIDGCGTSNNKSGFTLIANNGVVWADTIRGKKWGQAFEEDSRFFVVIDFPSGSYDLKDLIDRFGLNMRNEGEAVSGIRLREDKPFDSVQISIYKDMAETYCFKNKGFIDFITEVTTIVSSKNKYIG